MKQTYPMLKYEWVAALINRQFPLLWKRRINLPDPVYYTHGMFYDWLHYDHRMCYDEIEQVTVIYWGYLPLNFNQISIPRQPPQDIGAISPVVPKFKLSVLDVCTVSTLSWIGEISARCSFDREYRELYIFWDREQGVVNHERRDYEDYEGKGENSA